MGTEKNITVSMIANRFDELEESFYFVDLLFRQKYDEVDLN
jgi:hypothetical protein